MNIIELTRPDDKKGYVIAENISYFSPDTDRQEFTKIVISGEFLIVKENCLMIKNMLQQCK